MEELGTDCVRCSELASELTKLQTDVPADPFESTRATVEAELKRPIKELFARFDEAPVASGSIGQAHRATLPDGREVIVKVQHPDIARRVQTDLAILAELARLAEEYITEMRPYRPTAVVAEFRRVLLRELDFRRELRHLQIFAKNFAGDPSVKFPTPVPELSTGRVLTMEYLDGTPLTKLDDPKAAGIDPDELARRGARVFLEMIFRDGFYHADPHPGNVLVLSGGVIGLFDCGMAGRVDDRLRSQIEAAMVAVMSNDPASVTDLVMQVGEVPPHFEPADLQTEVAEQMAFYWGMPLDQFQLGAALEELTEAVRRYHVLLPPPLALLLKVLVMLEGTARLVNPSFNLIEVLEPYRRRFLLRRLSPKRLARRLLAAARDWDEVMSGHAAAGPRRDAVRPPAAVRGAVAAPAPGAVGQPAGVRDDDQSPVRRVGVAVGAPGAAAGLRRGVDLRGGRVPDQRGAGVPPVPGDPAFRPAGGGRPVTRPHRLPAPLSNRCRAARPLIVPCFINSAAINSTARQWPSSASRFSTFASIRRSNRSSVFGVARCSASRRA